MVKVMQCSTYSSLLCCEGDCDGDIDGVEYFTCTPGKGLMVRPHEASWHGHNCHRLLTEEDYNLDESLSPEKHA